MTYRLFFRDPASNRVLTSRALADCADDRSAMLRMTTMDDGRAVELWQGTRLVGTMRRP